ncbi:hypothetical protein, partial [Klebsiella aerogenes]|uniref:hypothetical protein n=1 Tax=Klebsiella aerogenes TaxID=548 RepID=UPI0022308D71
ALAAKHAAHAHRAERRQQLDAEFRERIHATNVSSGFMDANARAAIRHKLIEQRLGLPDRLARAADLQEVLRVWLLRRQETTIGAYWPIKG